MPGRERHKLPRTRFQTTENVRDVIKRKCDESHERRATFKSKDTFVSVTSKGFRDYFVGTETICRKRRRVVRDDNPEMITNDVEIHFVFTHHRFVPETTRRMGAHGKASSPGRVGDAARIVRTTRVHANSAAPITKTSCTCGAYRGRHEPKRRTPAPRTVRIIYYRSFAVDNACSNSFASVRVPTITISLLNYNNFVIVLLPARAISAARTTRTHTFIRTRRRL